MKRKIIVCSIAFVIAFIATFALVSIAQAAVVTIVPGDSATAIQNKLNFATSADTILLPAGTLNLGSGKLVLRAGTLTSSPLMSGTINFNTSGAAITAKAGAKIIGIGINNPGGDCVQGNHVTDCALKFKSAGGRSTGQITVDRNYFHDSEGSFRDWDGWGITGDSSYSFNEFKNTTYGAHLIISDGTLMIQGNTGTGFDQMSLEGQDFDIVHGKGKVIYQNNVMYGWRTGSTGSQNNAFGYSFGTQYTGSLTVKNNYIALGDWDANGKYFENQRNGGTHWGYGAEHGGMNACTVDGNVIIGSWVQGLVTMTRATMNNTKVYGSQIWGPWGGEHGNEYHGSWTSTGNSQGNLPIASAPKPPRRVTGRPWITTTQPTEPPPPTPTYGFAMTNVLAHECTIAFTDTPANATLAVKFTSDPAAGTVYDLGTIPLPAGTTNASFVKLPNNWKMIAYPVVNGVIGAAYKFQTQRQDPQDWPNYPKPELKSATTPPLADFDFLIQFKAGVFKLVISPTVSAGKKPTSIVINFADGTAQTVNP